jgi:hypothetical protein
MVGTRVVVPFVVADPLLTRTLYATMSPISPRPALMTLSDCANRMIFADVLCAADNGEVEFDVAMVLPSYPAVDALP